MSYYSSLISAWNSAIQPPAGITGAGLSTNNTTDENLALLWAWTVPGPNVDVKVSSVVGYLALNSKLYNLQNYASTAVVGINGATTASVTAAKELVSLMASPNAPNFQTSVSSVYSTIQMMLEALASDSNTGITSTDVTNLLALAATTILWWQSVGLTSPPNIYDLQAAGLSTPG